MGAQGVHELDGVHLINPIYIGSGSNVNHFLVVNVRTTESATHGG